MKTTVSIITLLLSSFVSISQTDTLFFVERQLGSVWDFYVIPNGRFLMQGHHNSYQNIMYGDWFLKEDSILLNVDYVHFYVNIKSIEEQKDTNYTIRYNISRDAEGQIIEISNWDNLNKWKNTDLLDLNEVDLKRLEKK